MEVSSVKEPEIQFGLRLAEWAAKPVLFQRNIDISYREQNSCVYTYNVRNCEYVTTNRSVNIAQNMRGLHVRGHVNVRATRDTAYDQNCSYNAADDKAVTINTNLNFRSNQPQISPPGCDQHYLWPRC
jgi:hypothetical protein